MTKKSSKKQAKKKTTKNPTTKKKAKKPTKTVAGAKHAGGRPTLYKAEYSTDAHVKKFIAKCKKDKEVVTLCGYAVYIDVSEDVFPLWKKKHPKFIGTLVKIKQTSKSQLFQGGLNKTLSSRIVKLGLSANHGMIEKTAQEFTGTDGGPIAMQIVDFAKAGK